MLTRQIRMREQPAGQIRPDHFCIDEVELPAPAPGQVVTRTRAFSLDPYLAMRMRDWRMGEPDWRQGVIVGRTIGDVVESHAKDINVGDVVLGFGRWQDHDVRPASELRKIDIKDITMSAHLGPLGSSGLSAWVGVNVLAPHPGETITVSSAAGAVGSIAGQLARLRGARVVGIAGGPAKCERLLSEFRFDAAVDYQASDFLDRLAAATPDGVHGHFENIGAPMLDPILGRIADRGRVALCGLLAHYQDNAPVALANFRELLQRVVTLQAFRTADYAAEHDKGRAEIAGYIRAGSLRYAETLCNGLDTAPEAYVAMLAGKGSGKHVVLLQDGRAPWRTS